MPGTINKRYIYFIIFFMVFLQSCMDTWENSPNQKFGSDTPRDLNAKNLSRLSKAIPDDTITIAFVGDSQRFYDELEAFISKANSIKEIDFVLLAGDITDFGLLQEYEWITDRLSKLSKPYIAVVGNHDVVANGEDIFKRVFGPLNDTFIYDSVRFILHNTNSREYTGNNVPDMEWLAQGLMDTVGVKYQIAVSHVPPFGGGDFNPELEKPYSSLFSNSPNFLLSLHGHTHEHRDYYHFQDGVRYMTSHSFDQRSFVLLKIVNGEIRKEIVDY